MDSRFRGNDGGGAQSGDGSGWRPAWSPSFQRMRLLPSHPSFPRKRESTKNHELWQVAPERARNATGRWLRVVACAFLLPAALVLALAAPLRGQELRDGLSVAYGNPPAPRLALEDIDGREHRLADLRGRVVVVNFWATWCPPCVAEMPAIQRMHVMLEGEGLSVLAVNAGESAEDIRSFVRDFDPALTFPLLRDPKGDTFAQWRVRGLPHTFVVDGSGNLAYSAEGARQMDSPHIIERLRALLE